MAAIDEWRIKIDIVDRKIAALLNERARYADEIGKIKEKLGLEAYSPEREKEVLRNVMQTNTGPLTSGALRRLFERIIDESRKLERDSMITRRKSSREK
jgi:chorismate mutase